VRRRYIIPLVSGLGMFAAIHVVDAILAHAGMHAETTFLDDALLGVLTAALLIVFERQHERELRRQRRIAGVISDMNHHLRNALQVIVYRTNLEIRDRGQLREIRDAVDRIDWALREILPNANVRLKEVSARKTEVVN